MEKLMFLLRSSRHNYILYLKGLGYKVAKRLLTHKEMYQSHLTMTELAIPDPA